MDKALRIKSTDRKKGGEGKRKDCVKLREVACGMKKVLPVLDGRDVKVV